MMVWYFVCVCVYCRNIPGATFNEWMEYRVLTYSSIKVSIKLHNENDCVTRASSSVTLIVGGKATAIRLY